MNLRKWRPFFRKSRDPEGDRRLAARGRLYAYLGPEIAMTQLYDGQLIYVDPQDEQISSHIIGRGYWEAWVDAAVQSLIKPGDRIVEVGANIGYYTLLMARAVGPQGRIDSFEANPRVADLLQKSLMLNGWNDRVTVHVNAAADAPGPIAFVTSRRQPGGGHVLAGAGDMGPESVHITAQGVRLDDVVADGPVDLLRLDAEGFEPQILLGAQSIIARSPNLKICLEWDRIQMSARTDVEAFADRLIEAGMKFWLIEYDGSLSPLTRENLLVLPHHDIVASRTQPF